jgi:hypothetical protein
MINFEVEAIKGFIDNLYRTKPEMNELEKILFFQNYVVKHSINEQLYFYGLMYFPEAFDKFVTQAEEKALLIKQDVHQLN